MTLQVTYDNDDGQLISDMVMLITSYSSAGYLLLIIRNDSFLTRWQDSYIAYGWSVCRWSCSEDSGEGNFQRVSSVGRRDDNCSNRLLTLQINRIKH